MMDQLKKPSEHRQGQMVRLIDHIHALMELRHHNDPVVIEEMFGILEKLWMFDITNHGDLYLTSGGRVVLDKGYGEYFNEYDHKLCTLDELGRGLRLEEFQRRLEAAIKTRDGVRRG